MELGTGTTDANMDEWLEVTFDLHQYIFVQLSPVPKLIDITSICSALQGTAFAKDKAKKNK